MKIKLTRQDLHECEVLGRDTVKVCKMQKFSPRLDTPDENRVLSNIQGFKAEYAVAKILGCKLPTLNIVTDGGVDLWAEDIGIDVKYTKREDGDLIFDDFDSFKADVAVLVATTREKDQVTIVGWLDKETFEARAYDHDYGYGARKVVANDDLFNIESLWTKVVDARFGVH